MCYPDVAACKLCCCLRARDVNAIHHRYLPDEHTLSPTCMHRCAPVPALNKVQVIVMPTAVALCNLLANNGIGGFSCPPQGFPELTKLVLVGDHLQLPATVLSELCKMRGYARPLFGRLQVDCVLPEPGGFCALAPHLCWCCCIQQCYLSRPRYKCPS